MNELLQDAVRALRLGETAAGNDLLTGLIDVLARSLSHGPLAARAAAFIPVLERVLAAQERGDFLYVADLLEHELAPLIAPA